MARAEKNGGPVRVPTLPESVVPRAKITVTALQALPFVRSFRVSEDWRIFKPPSGMAMMVGAARAKGTLRSVRRDVEVLILEVCDGGVSESSGEVYDVRLGWSEGGNNLGDATCLYRERWPPVKQYSSSSTSNHRMNYQTEN